MKHDAVLIKGRANMNSSFPWECRRCHAALADDERHGECPSKQLTVWDCIELTQR